MTIIVGKSSFTKKEDSLLVAVYRLWYQVVSLQIGGELLNSLYMKSEL